MMRIFVFSLLMLTFDNFAAAVPLEPNEMSQFKEVYAFAFRDLQENLIANVNESLILHKQSVLQKLVQHRDAYDVALDGLGEKSRLAIWADDSWLGGHTIRNYLDKNLPKTAEALLKVVGGSFSEDHLNALVRCAIKIDKPRQRIPDELWNALTVCSLSEFDDEDYYVIFKWFQARILPKL